MKLGYKKYFIASLLPLIGLLFCDYYIDSSGQTYLSKNKLFAQLEESAKNKPNDSKTTKSDTSKSIKHIPLQDALSFIKGFAYSVKPGEILESKGGWNDFKSTPNFSRPHIDFLKDFDLLNRQVAMIIESKINSLCPIRPRSSNGPPNV